ncbi:hypothetical protein FQZ97_1045860 [compost metagenome]
MLTALSFSDDDMAPLNTVAEVVDYYSQAGHSSLLNVSPDEAGMSEVGHFKMFFSHAAETIRPLIRKSLTTSPECPDE